MKNKRLKAALIGCGYIGINRHLPSLISHPNVEAVAFVDANERKAKDIATKHKKNYYASLSDMLEKEEDVDLIDIATPINTHGMLAIEALKHDKHVILEKPMATSREECEQIISLGHKKNLKVTVFHTMKVYPIAKTVKCWIDNLKIGKPYFTSFLTSYGELQPWIIQQGGALWEIGTHRIYLIMYWLGKVNIRDVIVYDHIKAFPELGEIKNMEVVMETENGIADLHLLNSGFDKSPDLINIYGDKGMIQVLPLALNAAYVYESGRYLQWKNVFLNHVISNSNLSFQILKGGLNYLLRKTKIFPHFLILDNFINSIFTDGQLIVPPEEGLEVVRNLKAIEDKIYSEKENSPTRF